MLDADVSDAAIRLYAVLLRYGQSSGLRRTSNSHVPIFSSVVRFSNRVTPPTNDAQEQWRTAISQQWR
ncbi:MAG TPA: hypothetical protein VFN80_10075 [Acidothermaceae bacterium]|nr:hypothetical protein [Acidothermaceae bacterium]